MEDGWYHAYWALKEAAALFDVPFPVKGRILEYLDGRESVESVWTPTAGAGSVQYLDPELEPGFVTELVLRLRDSHHGYWGIVCGLVEDGREADGMWLKLSHTGDKLSMTCPPALHGPAAPIWEDVSCCSDGYLLRLSVDLRRHRVVFPDLDRQLDAPRARMRLFTFSVCPGVRGNPVGWDIVSVKRCIHDAASFSPARNHGA
ncbi:hypothetical protein DIPPA_29416 [Diplonema papillatum]|nr:hypothetical protein DIPPA_29416 [Diplonema papillatum]